MLRKMMYDHGISRGAIPQRVESMRSQGQTVMSVAVDRRLAGDGTNDAPALARARVGMARGTGTDVAMEGPGVTPVKGDPRGIVRVRRLSLATMRNIKQNLFFAFVCNSLGIPIAAGAGFFRMVAGHSERHGERERGRYRPVGAPVGDPVGGRRDPGRCRGRLGPTPVGVAPVDVAGRSSRSSQPSAYPSGAHSFPVPGMAHFRQCWGTVRCAQSSFRPKACRNDDGSVTLVQAMPDSPFPPPFCA
jgi:hypothetical protein